VNLSWETYFRSHITTLEVGWFGICRVRNSELESTNAITTSSIFEPKQSRSHQIIKCSVSKTRCDISASPKKTAFAVPRVKFTSSAIERV
jgi:hypothetical protein